MIKVCSKCKQEKDSSCFHSYKRNKDGLQSYCKSCKTILLKEYKEQRKAIIPNIKEKYCDTCNKTLDINNFNYNPLAKNFYNNSCIFCKKEYDKVYYKENSVEYKKRAKEFVLNNKERVRKYHRERHAYKYKNDNIYNVTHRLRHRLNSALEAKFWKKNTHFSEYIGCSREFLIEHLESQFHSGMSWGNKGKWHIDHIIPLSSAKTEEELYKLCHYTNLQPMWGLDNILKGNKING